MFTAASSVAGGHHYHYLSSHGVRNFSSSSFSCSNRRKFSIIISSISHIRSLSFTLHRNSIAAAASLSSSTRNLSNSINDGSSFTWDDVFQISRSRDVSSDLGGFFQKINLCNRGSEKRSDFIPFVIENQIVGYIHNGFLDHLSKFKDVFTCIKDSTYGSQSGHVTLQSVLKTPKCRTEALANVVKCLGEEVIPVSAAIPGYFILWRTSIFLAGTCSSTLLWDKGLWSSHEWLC